MSRFLSLILLLACLSLIVWFLPSTRNLNKDVGARIVGMWKVVTPEGVADGPQASKDFDEVYLMTRYASVEHWRATRETTRHGGNGPDWEKCKSALDLRQSLTLSSHVVFLKGQMAAGGPYFMPGLDESYEKKSPK